MQVKQGIGRIFNRRRITEMAVFGTAAVFVRVLYAGLIVKQFGFMQYSDLLYMHQLAKSLSQAAGFTIGGQWVFNQSVGYPAFISIFYGLISPQIPVAIVVNILLGSLSVVLLYVFSIMLFNGYSYKGSYFSGEDAVARCACALAVIYPDSLLYCPLFASENLLIPAILALLIVTLIDWKRRWMAGVAVGIAAALAASVKAYAIFLCVFIPFIWKLRNRRVFVSLCFSVLTGAIILLPWTYANYKASVGKIIPFSASMGTAFLDGTNPGADGRPTNRYRLSDDAEKGHSEIELNDMRMKQAVSYIRANPSWYTGLLAMKLVRSFSPARDFMFQNAGEQRFFTEPLSRWLPTAFNALLLAGVIMGLLVSIRKQDVFIVGVSILSASLIIQMIFFAYPRYRFPFLFCLLPFAALGYIYAGDLIRRGAMKGKANHARVDFSGYYNRTATNMLFRWIDWQKIGMLEKVTDAARPKVVIDLGCGAGNIASRLSSRVICLDNNFDLIKVCAKKHLRGLVINMEKGLPLLDSSCDLVIMADAIEHVRNREVLLEELYRILSPGGYLVLFTPPYDSVRWIIAEKLHFLLLRTPADHISPYTEEALRYYLGRFFSSIEVQRLNFNLSMSAIAKKPL